MEWYRILKIILINLAAPNPSQALPYFDRLDYVSMMCNEQVLLAKRCTVHHCTVHHCTVHSARCPVHSAQCTVHHCTMHICLALHKCCTVSSGLLPRRGEAAEHRCPHQSPVHQVSVHQYIRYQYISTSGISISVHQYIRYQYISTSGISTSVHQVSLWGE